MQKQEYEDDGISLGQLFSVMFGRKLLLLIITICVFILGTIVFKFAYNDQKEVYTTQFTYTDESLLEGNYLDGTTFNYREVVSLTNLERVKASSEDYANINVESMYESGRISIQYYTTYVTINSQETTTIADRYYTLTVYASYFSNANQAKSFVNDLVSYPIERNKDIVTNSDYTSNLSLYTQATSYEDQIAFLQNQVELLQENYTNLIETYGNYSLSNGDKLQNILNEISATFQTTTLESLAQEVIVNGYVKDLDSDYMNQLRVTEADLKRQIATSNANLEALIEQRNDILTSLDGTSIQQIDISSYNEQIVSLTLSISELEEELDNVTKKIQASSTQTTEQLNFATRLGKYYDQLKTYTTDYHTNELEVVNALSNVDFYNTSIIVSSGTINIVLAAIVFIVLGFVGACCVNLILDSKKLSKYYVEAPKKENE